MNEFKVLCCPFSDAATLLNSHAVDGWNVLAIAVKDVAYGHLFILLGRKKVV